MRIRLQVSKEGPIDNLQKNPFQISEIGFVNADIWNNYWTVKSRRRPLSVIERQWASVWPVANLIKPLRS